MKSAEEWASEWAAAGERALDPLEWKLHWASRVRAVQDDALASAPKRQAKFVRFALKNDASIWIRTSSIMIVREWNINALPSTMLLIGSYADGRDCEVAEPIEHVLAKLEVSNAS